MGIHMEFEDNYDDGRVKKVRRKQFWMRIIVVLLCLAAIGGVIYYRYAKRSMSEEEIQDLSMNGRYPGAENRGNILTATGTTVIGMDAEGLDLSELDTDLEIEEVYLAAGDEVQKGTAILKLTDESLQSAKDELASNVTTDKLAYRTGKIEYEQNVLTAEYERQGKKLAGEQAEMVLQHTMQELTDKLKDAKTAYEDAVSEVEEYQTALSTDQYKADYQVEALYDIYVEDYEKVVAYLDSFPADADATSIALESGRILGADQSELKLYQDLWKLVAQEKQEYLSAKENAELEAEKATRRLAELPSELENLQAALIKAEAEYDTKKLQAQATYQTTMEEAAQADSDYETTVKKAKETLTTLEDTLEEAQSDLQLFTELLSDGKLYTGGSGVILALMVKTGDYLQENGMVLAYSATDVVNVRVSIDQSRIAKLDIGAPAQVIIPDAGTYEGTITQIDPTSSSTGRTSVTYSVTVKLAGDVSGLSGNMTAQVSFDLGDDTTTASVISEVSPGEITESGSLSYGITSQQYDLNLLTREEQEEDDDEEEDTTRYLRVEEVFVAVGQRVSEGDPVLSFTNDSIAAIEKKLNATLREREIALAEAKSAYNLQAASADLTRQASAVEGDYATSVYQADLLELDAQMNSCEAKIANLNQEIENILEEIDTAYEDLTAVKDAYKQALSDYEYAVNYSKYAEIAKQEIYLSAKEKYDNALAAIEQKKEQITQNQESIMAYQAQIEELQYKKEINELEARQTYESAVTKKDSADNTYRNTMESGQEQIDSAKEDVEEITQILEAFHEFVGDGTIYAKETGMVTQVGYEAGDDLEQAGVMVSVAVLDSKTIDVDVSQEDIVKLAIGDRVDIRFTAYEQEYYTGRITSIETTSTAQGEATVSYRVTVLVEGDTSRLYRGMTADVTFMTQEDHDE